MVNIVIVDDYLETAETLSTLYRTKQNVEIVGLAQDSGELWEIVESKEVDLLSLDIQLGKENGLDICKVFHEKHPDVFIVMCSVEATEQNKRIAREAGASHFLAKPIGLKEVSEVLEMVVNSKRNSNMDRSLLTSESIDRLFEGV